MLRERKKGPSFFKKREREEIKVRYNEIKRFLWFALCE